MIVLRSSVPFALPPCTTCSGTGKIWGDGKPCAPESLTDPESVPYLIDCLDCAGRPVSGDIAIITGPCPDDEPGNPGEMIWPESGCLTRCDTCDGEGVVPVGYCSLTVLPIYAECPDYKPADHVCHARSATEWTWHRSGDSDDTEQRIDLSDAVAGGVAVIPTELIFRSQRSAPTRCRTRSTVVKSSSAPRASWHCATFRSWVLRSTQSHGETTGNGGHHE